MQKGDYNRPGESKTIVGDIEDWEKYGVKSRLDGRRVWKSDIRHCALPHYNQLNTQIRAAFIRSGGG